MLKEKTALVIGGGGFLGSHLVEALCMAGYAVTIFNRSINPRFRSLETLSGVQWVEGNFLNSQALSNVVQPGQIIFHLVSTTLPKTSNENFLFDADSNILGTLRLLEVMQKKGAKKIVFASSGGTVYGIPKAIPIPEHAATDPICAYGISKLAIEKYLHLYHTLYGLDYCILRSANPYGEYQRTNTAQGVITTFLYKISKGDPLDIWGDGEVIRDYVYIKDVASAFIQAAAYQGKKKIFNVGSGVGYSLNEIIKTIKKTIGREVPLNYLPGRKFDVPANALDISNAKKYLHWSPETSLEEGITRTWNWILQSK